jgi:hypothetical protein
MKYKVTGMSIYAECHQPLSAISFLLSETCYAKPWALDDHNLITNYRLPQKEEFRMDRNLCLAGSLEHTENDLALLGDLLAAAHWNGPTCTLCIVHQGLVT